MKDTKKMILVGMLCAFYVLSLVVAAKMTVFFHLAISCNIFIYPFTFLFVLLITHFYGYKTGIVSVFLALFSGILFFLFSMLVCNLPIQVDSLFQANALQTVLAPEMTNHFYHPAISFMIGSLLSFGISQLLMIFLYSFLQKKVLVFVSVPLTLLVSLLVDLVFFLFITKMGVVGDMTLGMVLMNQFIVRVFLSFIFTFLFVLLSMQKKSS